MRPIVITTENGKMELTWEQENEIRNQMVMFNALDLLENFDVNTENITDDELLDLGMALDDIYFSNAGDDEFHLLQEKGYID